MLGLFELRPLHSMPFRLLPMLIWLLAAHLHEHMLKLSCMTLASQVRGEGARLVLRDTTCTLEAPVGQRVMLTAVAGPQVMLDRAVLALKSKAVTTSSGSSTGARGSTGSRGSSSSGASSSGGSTNSTSKLAKPSGVSMLKVHGASLVAKDSKLVSDLPRPMFPDCMLCSSTGLLKGCKFDGVRIVLARSIAGDDLLEPSALDMRGCEYEVAFSAEHVGLHISGGSKASLTTCSLRADMQVC